MCVPYTYVQIEARLKYRPGPDLLDENGGLDFYSDIYNNRSMHVCMCLCACQSFHFALYYQMMSVCIRRKIMQLQKIRKL